MKTKSLYMPRRMLCASIAMILAISTLIPCTGIGYIQANASSRSATLRIAGYLEYTSGTWHTHIYCADDGEGERYAYCVEPEKYTPDETTYEKKALNPPSGRDDELRADIWFGYGGPGFDKSMWPETNWDGNPMSKSDYYLLTHILLSDTFNSNGRLATYGASAHFCNWVCKHITGFDLNTGELINAKATGRQMMDRCGEVPRDFECYRIAGGPVQNLVVGSYYNASGSIKMTKLSSNTDISNGNACYSMKGISYGIYTDSDCDSAHSTGKTLVLDANGSASVDDMLPGTYYVKEKKSSVQGTGYAYDSSVYTVKVEAGKTSWLHDNTNAAGNADGNDVTDTPQSADISILIQKCDALTGTSAPSGAGSLAGALFSVKYYRNLDGETSGKAAKSWIFKTNGQGAVNLKTDAQNCYVSGSSLFKDPKSGKVLFPLGTYLITETTPPVGYELASNNSATFTIVADGTKEHEVSTSNALTDSGVLFYDAPVRHDLSFAKRDMDTQRPMGKIPFLVSRLSEDGKGIIERHVVVTDANGIYNSSTTHANHTSKTNANDAAVSVLPNGSYCVDESALDADAGTWFGKTGDGSWVNPNDALGAFPDSSSCKYLIEELPVSANAGKALVSFEAYAHAAHASTVDLGTIGNSTPTLATNAYDSRDGDKLVSRDIDAVIRDTVSYTGLVAGHAYTVRGKLVDAATGSSVLDAQGRAVESSSTFTARAAAGTLELDFTLDATLLADGTRVVACEELYEGERLLVSHNDLEDSAQTVSIVQPSIHTTALDAADGDALVTGDVDASVLDQVAYTGLTPGAQYTLTGTIMNKATGEALATSSCQFTPEKSSGTVSVSFSFDAADLDASTQLVIFERLERDGRTIAAHEDINDEAQTVSVYPPALETRASDPEDGDNVISGDLETKLVDTVSYAGLKPGREYQLIASLIDKVTGQPMLDSFGRPISAESSFAASESSGSTDVTFCFDAVNISSSRACVVFEELYRDGRHLASHINLEDAAQTIIIERPRIQSMAHADGNSKTIMRDVGVQIIDTVSYSNLKPGKSYELTGSVINKSTGEPLHDENGNILSSQKSFTAESTSGYVEVPYTLDASSLDEGTELVVFEKLLCEGVELASHEDIEDACQTVMVKAPTIATSAKSEHDTKEVVRDTDAFILDTVSYSGLAPHCSYTLVGSIMNKSTGEAITKPDGSAVEAKMDFTAEEPDGSCILTFEFDASLLESGTQLVAFEKLLRDGREIARHEDIDDAEQTVSIQPPVLKTNARDPHDGDQEIALGETAQIQDVVSYEGLRPGATYELTGTLMNAQNGEPLLDAQSEGISSTQSFVPEQSNGSVEMNFSFEVPADMQECSCVVFERLYRNGSLIAEHADLEDALQTVSLVPPSIATNAVDAADGDKSIMCDKAASIIDNVSYAGLIAGETYKLNGTLMIDDGTLEGRQALDAFEVPISAQMEFVAEASHGKLTLPFELDTSLFETGTRLVVFETLSHNNKVIATHADIQDEAQTVCVGAPFIMTHASDEADADKQIAPKTRSKIVDKVEYSGLDAGKEYIISGTLMDKSTGEPLLIAHSKICARERFVATQTSGSIDVAFEFDASRCPNTDIVVFEQLLDAHETMIASHENINDANQTVHVQSQDLPAVPSNTPSSAVNTGDTQALIICLLGLLLALTLLFAIWSNTKTEGK